MGHLWYLLTLLRSSSSEGRRERKGRGLELYRNYTKRSDISSAIVLGDMEHIGRVSNWGSKSLGVVILVRLYIEENVLYSVLRITYRVLYSISADIKLDIK